MTTRILIIGGYGNFGQFIAGKLAREEAIQLIIAGRDEKKAKACAASLSAIHPVEAYRLDVNDKLSTSLAMINPDAVIYTSGPYQGQSYHVAATCIAQGCHYIDLADARDFVANITTLDAAAKEKGVLICSGASSVPCLTAAVIDHYTPHFAKLETLEYAIATAQLTNRGLATTSAALSYAGKPFQTLIDGRMQNVYGWLDLKFRKFWELGFRPMGSCDIPDLAIFPKRYPQLHTMRFRGGLELKLLHVILWLLSWMVRLRLLPSLQPAAKLMLHISFLFDCIGKDNSGFYMSLGGKDRDGQEKQITFEIVAKHGDGALIPSMPSIILAKKLASGHLTRTGATPCIDMVTLEEYLEELKGLDIRWRDDSKETRVL
jgi:saccharopine dehydrogenase-like NADP-dependent oxidoreductase